MEAAVLDEFLRANLASWDESVALHVASELYDVEGFKGGRSSLSVIEREELGPRVHDGTRLLHLQCHFGLDTLSWARRGAVVTGVDFSGEAIATARTLADDVGLSARATFVLSDIESLPAALQGSFDVVYASWGALIWLSDLERWAQVVAHYLAPGGVLYLAEFHPYVFLLADDATPESLRIGYPYFQYGTPQRFDEEGDYADPGARPKHTVTYEWNHGFSEIIDPLLRSGLRLEFLHELPYTVPGLPFTFLERCDDGLLRVRGHHDDVPLSFSLLMTKER
jgi:SAM-dependent methyltransferase